MSVHYHDDCNLKAGDYITSPEFHTVHGKLCMHVHMLGMLWISTRVRFLFVASYRPLPRLTAEPPLAHRHIIDLPKKHLNE
jgi:hypothetical protein